MSIEVFENARGVGWKNIEVQLVLQCAPLIAGLKLSNLLIIPASEEETIQAVLHHTDISFYRLLKTEEKAVLLLFRRSQLEMYLMKPEVRDIFSEEGYQSFSLENILYTFRKRYEAYMAGGTQFPHEMGLILGYPPEDVRGFMKHKGKNFLYSGYWKVYDNMPGKVKLFQKFDIARNTLVQLLYEGVCIEDILDICNEEILRKAAI